MKWLIIAFVITIVLLLILLVWQKLRQRFGIATLRLSVGSSDGRRYEVVVQELHSSRQGAEFVRILLGAAAAMLHWIDQKPERREAMRDSFLDDLERLGKLQLTPESKLAASFEESLQITEVSDLTVTQLLTATLYYQNLAYRLVRMRGLRQEQVEQLGAIWIAMVSVSLAKWDQKMVDRFQGSLRAMVGIYQEDTEYLRLQSVIDYPNRAFLQYLTRTDTGE